MIIIKIISLIIIFLISTLVGILLSKKYVKRESQLKELKVALNMFKSKIKYTYEPISDIFKEISYKYNEPVSKIFNETIKNMKEETAGLAWERAIESVNSELNKEDKNVLKSLSKTLGKINAEGQISEIELTDNFLDLQIENAIKERIKNEKLYKTLGVISGLGFVIILI